MGNQIWCHYRAPYVTKLLVRRKFWKRIAGFFLGTDRVGQLLGVVDTTDFTKDEENMKGIFIGCHQAHFLDLNDTTENLRDIISQQNAVKEEMDQMEMDLKDKVVVTKTEFEEFKELKEK